MSHPNTRILGTVAKHLVFFRAKSSCEHGGTLSSGQLGDCQHHYLLRLFLAEPLDSRGSGGSRPRLALKPRSSDLPPLQQDAPPPSSTASHTGSEANSTDGHAEPVVAARTGPKPNPFGAAKPVDVKEKPEEEKPEPIVRYACITFDYTVSSQWNPSIYVKAEFSAWSQPVSAPLISLLDQGRLRFMTSQKLTYIECVPTGIDLNRLPLVLIGLLLESLQQLQSMHLFEPPDRVWSFIARQ